VITLISEVANAYLTVLADRELLRVTQVTLESQQASYDLTRLRYDGDQSTALDLRQAEISVRTAQVNLASYRRQLGQDRNALVLLLGAPIPGDLVEGPDIDGQRLLEDLPAGVPSELLARRPDVLAAEHNLVAANANIGAARAAFFPSITLTGSLGTSSPRLSGLFDAGSRTWSFLPQIALPIFTGGANVANLAYAEEERNLYVATYEKAIQMAFQEVSNSLLSRDTLLDQLKAQVALEAASREAYRLSDMRFQGGIDNYLAVLDSQRTLYSAQQDLVTVKLSRLQNLVTLYKALGGGWNERTVAPAPPVAMAPRP
jgi:outer membrane protein, multidrug efflux system